jgi:hypothetical protein
LLQPSTEAELLTATELLKGEIAQHADLIVVPGKSAHGSMLCSSSARTGSNPSRKPQPQRSLTPNLNPFPTALPLACPIAGQDLYRTLPSKTLQLLKYALSSDCRYTHILKTDDDVFLRPQVRQAATKEPSSDTATALASFLWDNCTLGGPAQPCYPLWWLPFARPCFPTALAAAAGHYLWRALQLLRTSAV